MGRETPKTFLKHYFQLCYGKKFDCDNHAEIEFIIDEIIDATKKELRTEVSPMVIIPADIYNSMQKELQKEIEEKNRLLEELELSASYEVRHITEESFEGVLNVDPKKIEDVLRKYCSWSRQEIDSEFADRLIFIWDEATPIKEGEKNA